MFASPTLTASWEHRAFAFLRQELAPSPTRWRATLRITLLCALGTTIIMSLHVPNGEFLMIFFFAVSQPDAWASFRRARLRGIGTVIGGALGILSILTCGDKPWLFFSFQTIVFAVGLFLSVTTTIPYAVLIALFTFVIATPYEQINPEIGLRTALWRILLTWLAVVFGTLGQMVLWPEKPDKLLLAELAAHLQRGEDILERLLAQREVAVVPGRLLPSKVSAAAVANQLDLLASAEAGAPAIRQYHVQQIKLITDVELIFGRIVRLEGIINSPSSPVTLTDSLRARLGKIRQEMARLRDALKQECPPSPAFYEGIDLPANTSLEIVVQELAGYLRQIPDSMAFLKSEQRDLAARAPAFERIREPIAPGSIFTPACSVSNITAVQFALKGALAGSLCYVFYQALNWPGIATCVVTAMIVTQSSFGASVQKGALRLLGALFGAVMAFAIITVVMPNMETVASVVVVTSVPFFVAGWIVTGSNRISYVGMQTGLVLSLVLLNRLSPSTNLAPAGDRIFGVLIGIAAMGFINLSLWPNFAGKALHKKLAEAMRALAEIPRNMAGRVKDKQDLVTGLAHRELVAALTLYDESLHEFGSRETRADHQKSLATISRLQEIFLSLLAVDRQRAVLGHSALPAFWQERLQRLDEAVARRLEMLGGSPMEPAANNQPDLDQSLTDFRNVLQNPPTFTESDTRLPRTLAETFVAYGEVIEALKYLQAGATTARGGYKFI